MPTPAEIPTVDFDAKYKAAKPKVRAKIKAFKKEWRVIRPNQMMAGKLISHDGDINTSYINDYLLAHIHPDDREKFAEAAMDTETLDVEALMTLMQMLTEVAYDEVPSEPS